MAGSGSTNSRRRFDQPANQVDRLFDDTTAEAIRELIGDSRPRVLPVISSESDGNNWIPLDFGEVLADRLDLDVEVGITQREKIR
ncbi:hypothetical protein [Thiolapillus sp.]|uniref:hypothetical protein n=1 Tax=Thiolapillus sp. TaxID=2017437 RepID=UPI0025EA0F7F|nr:hypothetical protein [Thiolapillus sp.]